jgi:polysaccharide biosynthesis protein PelA
MSFLMFSKIFGAGKERWVVYYSDKAPEEAFDPYSLIALDSDYHPPLEALREKGKTLLGYISLGEVEEWRSWFEAVKQDGILGRENENWPGSYFVDLRDPRWVKRVIEDLIPQILHKGFDGLILDTLDNAETMERENPARYRGMAKGAANLVKAIKLHYPQIPVMVNRAYFLLPETAEVLDMALGESVMTDYDFENKEYLKRSREGYEEQVERLQEAMKLNPKLKVYTLDYWYPEQTDYIEEIYHTQRKNGFVPYVGTIELNQIIPEPK